VRDLAKRLVLTAQKDQTILLPCKDFRQYCGLIGNAAPEWRRLGYWLEFFALVEAAGIEPVSPENPNLLMAHDFDYYRFWKKQLQRFPYSPGVHWRSLVSTPVMEIFWRRRAVSRSDSCYSDSRCYTFQVGGNYRDPSGSCTIRAYRCTGQ
jgi:hypothetical protein